MIRHQLRTFLLATSLLASLPGNEIATGFRAGGVGHIPSRRTGRRFEAGATVVTDAEDPPSSWEEGLRCDAVDALLPVFFPNGGSSEFERDGGGRPMTAEASLKRLLRRKYHRGERGSDQPRRSADPDGPTVNESRGRLAALVLGTGVMRLRHWHAVATRCDDGMLPMMRSELPIPHPLGSSLHHSVDKDSTSNADDSPDLAETHLLDSGGYSVGKLLLVREMVDEHARYLSTEHSSPPVAWKLQSNDAAIELSIQHSIPPFLTSSLLFRYGWERADGMCSLANGPGPITLRRNAILFPGTDEELCDRLLEEDGICAEPLVKLPADPLMSGNLPCHQNGTIVPCDGGNMYVMGSTGNPGSIDPPTGAIRILPSPTNATTAVERRRNHKSIWSMRAWQKGYFEVQDAGSQLIARSVEVSPSEFILDYCAGNGGKTLALASDMFAASTSRRTQNPKSTAAYRIGRIVAHDVVEERLRQIRGSLPRAGFIDREGEGGRDGTLYYAESSRGNRECAIQIATSADLESARISSPPRYFDAVLVDAPCSTTGVLRRMPSQRWDLTEKLAFRELPDLQLEVLTKAAAFVREDGGRLVYATCSLLPGENEEVARRFETTDAFRTGGFERWDFVRFTEDGSVEGIDGRDAHTLTLLPSMRSDGFFIARWKRVKT